MNTASPDSAPQEFKNTALKKDAGTKEHLPGQPFTGLPLLFLVLIQVQRGRPGADC